jgi:hypothetical protein
MPLPSTGATTPEGRASRGEQGSLQGAAQDAVQGCEELVPEMLGCHELMSVGDGGWWCSDLGKYLVSVKS